MPEFLRTWGTQVQTQLTQLSVSQKLLIGTLMIVVAMALFLVVTVASSPTWVAVLDQPMDEATKQRIVNYLDMRRIEYKLDGDQIKVHHDKRYGVIASLQEQQMLPDDTSNGFAQLIKEQDVWSSSEQNRIKQCNCRIELCGWKSLNRRDHRKHWDGWFDKR